MDTQGKALPGWGGGGGLGGGRSPLMRDQQLQAKILRQRSKQMETRPVLRETFSSATHNLH